MRFRTSFDPSSVRHVLVFVLAKHRRRLRLRHRMAATIIAGKQHCGRREQNKENENGHLFLSVSFILLLPGDDGVRVPWIS